MTVKVEGLPSVEATSPPHRLRCDDLATIWFEGLEQPSLLWKGDSIQLMVLDEEDC